MDNFRLKQLNSMFNALCFLRLKEFCFLGILYYAVFKYLTHTQNQNNRVNPRIAITETQPLAFGQTWFTFSHFGGIKYFKANPWHPVILSHIHTSICISKKELTYIATVPFLHRVKLKTTFKIIFYSAMFRISQLLFSEVFLQLVCKELSFKNID